MCAPFVCGVEFITGPPNGPVLFCSLASVVVVCNAVGWWAGRVGGRPPPGVWAVGWPTRHGVPVWLCPVRATLCCYCEWVRVVWLSCLDSHYRDDLLCVECSFGDWDVWRYSTQHHRRSSQMPLATRPVTKFERKSLVWNQWPVRHGCSFDCYLPGGKFVAFVWSISVQMSRGWHKKTRPLRANKVRDISQGSAVTCTRRGVKYIDDFATNILRSVTIKEFWK